MPRRDHSEIYLNFDELKDKEGKKYLICRPELPLTVDLSKAVFFYWPDTDQLTIRLDNRDKKDSDR